MNEKRIFATPIPISFEVGSADRQADRQTAPRKYKIIKATII
jgi:hypothetical protein